jgi:predicted TIM-barrel fold metal-dependent hydrolase
VFLSSSGFDRDLATVDSMLGNGGVVWGSDYPHWDSHIPEHREGIFDGCPESLRERMFSANGRRCFHRTARGTAQ